MKVYGCVRCQRKHYERDPEYLPHLFFHDRPRCPTCGHVVHVQSADEGTSFYEPDERDARREGWDAALAAVRWTQYPAGLPRSAMVTAWLADVLDRLASEGPR